jgi:hypothetical protein
VYARTTLKKGIFQFKGKVTLDSCRVVNLVDGEQSFNGKPLNNAWSINRYDLGGVKSYVVYAHNSKDKDKFLTAFERAQEHVMEDSRGKRPWNGRQNLFNFFHHANFLSSCHR